MRKGGCTNVDVTVQSIVVQIPSQPLTWLHLTLALWLPQFLLCNYYFNMTIPKVHSCNRTLQATMENKTIIMRGLVSCHEVVHKSHLGRSLVGTTIMVEVYSWVWMSVCRVHISGRSWMVWWNGISVLYKSSMAFVLYLLLEIPWWLMEVSLHH